MPMTAAFARLALLLSLCAAPAGAQTVFDAPADPAAPLIAPARLAGLPMTVPADRARREISVTVTPGLTETRRLPTTELREARKAMLAGTEIPDAPLRALADLGDGLAALKYHRRLLARSPAVPPSDIAYYGTVAVATGRIWPLADVVAALHRLDPATEPAARVKAYAAMLYPHAWAGNALALDALIDFNGEGKLFGPMSEATRTRILEQGDAAGDGRAALRLAIALLQKPDPAPADRARAEAYLTRAMAADHLAVKTTAANLLALLKAGSDAPPPPETGPKT
jgi:hypothetical protein